MILFCHSFLPFPLIISVMKMGWICGRVASYKLLNKFCALFVYMMISETWRQSKLNCLSITVFKRIPPSRNIRVLGDGGS